MNAQEIETALQMFSGTENYYKHWAGLYYTDGVQYLAEQAGAYWLIDLIASHQVRPNVRKEEFQLWTVRCLNDLFSQRSAVISCDDGNDSPPLVTQAIDFTDFPLDNVRLYLELGSLDGVTPCQILMLPSER